MGGYVKLGRAVEKNEKAESFKLKSSKLNWKVTVEVEKVN